LHSPAHYRLPPFSHLFVSCPPSSLLIQILFALQRLVSNISKKPVILPFPFPSSMDGVGTEEVLAPLRLAVRQQVPAFCTFPKPALSSL
uniref:Uncharacterized protein n=1 Tax=Sus scrofa TaxID=9823 RepID=A0A8D0P1W4_PIG